MFACKCAGVCVVLVDVFGGVYRECLCMYMYIHDIHTHTSIYIYICIYTHVLACVVIAVSCVVLRCCVSFVIVKRDVCSYALRS